MRRGTVSNLDERIDAMREVRDSLLTAADTLEWAIRGLPRRAEARFEAYILSRLRILASNEHMYVTDDPSVDEIIEYLEGMTKEEEDEDE